MAALIIFIILIFASGEIVCLLSAVVLHESGHIIAALLISGELPRISFNIAGIRLRYYEIGGAGGRIIVSGAGPFVSILLALIFYSEKRFALASLGLGLVNLLPVSCLDGGSILRNAMEAILFPSAAKIICKIFSVAGAIIVFIFNCAVQLKYGANISLALITVYLIYCALGGDDR